MYKTTVNTLVNGVITNQKQQISKRWYCSAVPWHLGNVMLRNITFWYVLFLMCNDAVNQRIKERKGKEADLYSAYCQYVDL